MNESTRQSLSLIFLNGKYKDTCYPVRDGLIVGRGEQADVYVPDFKASRSHARIHCHSDGSLELEDLGSHNGTWVNDHRVSRISLVDRDVISIGTTRLEVVGSDRARSADAITGADDGIGSGPRIVRRLDRSVSPQPSELPRDDFLDALGVPTIAELAEGGAEPIQRLRAKVHHYAIVNDIAKALASTVQLPTLLSRALEIILQVIGADRGYVILVESDTGRQLPGAARRRGQSAEEVIPLQVSHTIIDYVIRERSVVLSSDAALDDRFGLKESIVLHRIRSVLCVPMVHLDRVNGVIQLDTEGSGLGFTDDDVELASVIAPVLAVAVENTRLFEVQQRTIDELRLANSKLLRAQEQLVSKERMAVLGRVTSGLAHEIRNLMGPFMLADLLQSQYPGDERIQEYATLMLEAYGRIGALVEEIRLMARGERPGLDVGSHDLRRTVEAVVRFLKCDQEIRQHQIVVDVEDLGTCRYDELRFKQVLINLIRNAAQAMPGSGEVIVRVRVDPDRVDRVRIEVVDRGTGVPAALKERIFEPFFTTKNEGGTGLGLDLCRGIVERHQGTIHCEDTPGGGATMVVTLPRSGPSDP